MLLPKNYSIRPPVQTFLVLMLFITGCNANSVFLKKDAGLASPSLLGGVFGSTASGVEDNAQATAIVALSGGVVGNRIGVSLGDQDRKEAMNAEYEALEYTPAGQPVKWHNTISGNSGSVTAQKTYDVGNRNCRQYIHKIVIGGREQAARGTACKEQDGPWQPVT